MATTGQFVDELLTELGHDLSGCRACGRIGATFVDYAVNQGSGGIHWGFVIEWRKAM
jgi:hypothetical protein